MYSALQTRAAMLPRCRAALPAARLVRFSTPASAKFFASPIGPMRLQQQHHRHPHPALSRGAASSAAAATVAVPIAPAAPASEKLPEQSVPAELDFDDVSQSFAVKSEFELWRGLLVFQLCSVRLLVSNARLLLTLGEKVLGQKLMHWVLRQTFFGHFCAGETDEEVARVVAKLEQSGIGGILDYAAEADVVVQQPGTDAPAGANSAMDAAEIERRDRTGIHSARTYDYAGEAECDANARICEQCIVAAGARTDSDGPGFAAIKLTALGKPELLEHLSKIIMETKRLFVAFAEEEVGAASAISKDAKAANGDESSSSSSTAVADAAKSATPPNPHPSIPVSRSLSFPQFFRGLKAINVNLPEEKARRLFARMDRDGSDSVDYLEWVSFLDPQLLGGLAPKFRAEGLPTLRQEELDKLYAMIGRLERLASLAAEKGVRMMVDAEQTYFQPAIDHLVLHLQRKYNAIPSANGGAPTPSPTPVIFHTYQCYLRDSHARVLLDLERSRREGFTFAAKIVRGAYMVQERKRAKDMDYQDPIMPNIQATHDNYFSVVSTLLRDRSTVVPPQVLVASHNEATVRFVTSLMRSPEVARSPSGGGVYFGQLLGMCDHVTLALGRHGFQAYKYVPYGPIHDVLPYLVRRAEENSDMLGGGAAKERELLWREIKRRYKAKVGMA